MTDKIREQIATMRDLNIPEVWPIADTMERLLTALEAAKAYINVSEDDETTEHDTYVHALRAIAAVEKGDANPTTD